MVNFFASLLALGGALLPAVAAAAAAKADPAQFSPCPLNYPAYVNTTEPDLGLTLNVFAKGHLANERALQLKPDPKVDTSLLVVVDADSPVLLGGFDNTSVKSVARDATNGPLVQLGPIMYLEKNFTWNEGGSAGDSFLVKFGNETDIPKGTFSKFVLTGPTSTGLYTLNRFTTTPNTISSFLLCKQKDDKGTFYQLFYASYNTPYKFTDCDEAQIHTAVTPAISNGNCTVGGYLFNEQPTVPPAGTD